MQLVLDVLVPSFASSSLIVCFLLPACRARSELQSVSFHLGVKRPTVRHRLPCGVVAAHALYSLAHHVLRHPSLLPKLQSISPGRSTSKGCHRNRAAGAFCESQTQLSVRQGHDVQRWGARLRPWRDLVCLCLSLCLGKIGDSN